LRQLVDEKDASALGFCYGLHDPRYRYLSELFYKKTIVLAHTIIFKHIKTSVLPALATDTL